MYIITAATSTTALSAFLSYTLSMNTFSVFKRSGTYIERGVDINENWKWRLQVVL